MFDYIFNILTAIVTSFSALLFSIIIIRDKTKRKYGKDKIYKLLENNFEHNLINDKEDILILLNSVNREYDSNYSIISILEDYKANLSMDKIKEENLFKNIHEKIKELIKIENQEKPFNNVPIEEKRILRNINENIKNNQIELIKINIQELASVITTRNKAYEKTNIINKWSLPVAIIGTIVAIIFGLLSIIK